MTQNMAGTRKNTFEVKWSIENVKSWLQTRDDTVFSPQFLAETLGNTCWKLKLSPCMHLAEKYISVALQRHVEDGGPELISLNCELSFLASDGSTLKSKSCRMKFASKTLSPELIVKEMEILEEKEETSLPEGVLTVRCRLWKAFSTVSKAGKCSIRSVIGTKCITLDGNIDNFSRLDIPTIVTVKFTSSSSTDINFVSFDVYLRERDVTIFERIEVDCKCFCTYSCKLFALDAGGQQKNCRFRDADLTPLLKSYKKCSLVSSYSWVDFIYNDFLQSETLKLKLEIAYFPAVASEHIEYELNSCDELSCVGKDIKHLNILSSEKINSSSSSELQMLQNEEKHHDAEGEQSGYEDSYFDASRKGHGLSTTLKQDLASLYDDRLFCDAKLQTDTETFPFHKCVLSARSPVFKKMFTTDMKERTGECINVPDISSDISSDTVRRMLQFLYTDLTGDLDMQSAKDLYIASDKYDIVSLKESCSSFMMKNLCPSNVCEVLILADMHQDRHLESTAQEYVLTNDEEVFYADEWKLFMKNYSGLAAKVMYLKCTKK